MGIKSWIVDHIGARLVSDNAIIVPLYQAAIGEYQVENIQMAIDAYTHDTDIFNAVNFISNAALSQGFYIIADQNYKNGKALDLIEDFNRTIRWGNRRGEKGLEELLRIVTKELLYGGNTFIEMLSPEKLEMLNQVQLSSIYKIYRNPQGDINKIQQLIGGRLNDLNPDTIIHIPWLQIDREPFGRGLIQPLISPKLDIKGKQIPPFYKIKGSLEYDLYRMIHRRGVPRSIFSFPEAGDELINSYHEQLKDPDVDASFATNTAVDIKSEQGGPAQGIQNLILWLDKRFQAGLQTPINNLLNASGYTEACYSEDTLTLTENGWRFYNEITNDEKIVTVNPATGMVEFHIPEARYCFQHDGEMIHFESSDCDILVTPYHSMHYKTRYWSDRPAEEVAKLKQINFLTNANWPEPNEVGSFTVKGVVGNGLRAEQANDLEFKADAWLKLVGYYVSEGAIRVNSQNKSLMGLAISQKKSGPTNNIRECLKELGIPFSEYPDKRFGAIEFAIRGGKRLINAFLECGKGVENKRIPRKYIQLPSRQLTILLDALIEGDGSRDNRPNRNCAWYFTVSEGLARDVLEIAMRIGYDAFIRKSMDKRGGKRRPVYTVSIHLKKKHETKLHSVGERPPFANVVNYKGKVYCFSVKNHLFITMRNGKPTVQGNSSRTAMELGQLIIRDLQKRLKQAIETEMYDRVLVQNGLDPKQSKVELHWGIKSNYEYNVNDILQVFDRNLIAPTEARRMLRAVGLELEDDSAFLNQTKK
ncbi:MAG: LAGLIDADG family homing endonuclease [Nitrososphaerales archaeon]